MAVSHYLVGDVYVCGQPDRPKCIPDPRTNAPSQIPLDLRGAPRHRRCSHSRNRNEHMESLRTHTHSVLLLIGYCMQTVN